MNQSESIPLAGRCWLWTGAWCVAGIAMIATVGIVPFFWLFPMGLFQFVLSEDAYQDSVLSLRFSPLLIAGWLIYAVLTILGLSFRRRAHYWAVYAILCVLLALNVVGCYSGISRLHFE